MEKQIAINQFGIQQIYQIENLDEVLELIKQMDALKTVLETANTFREQSVRFAKLEAATLIRVVELGGVNRLKGNRKKVAVWLHSLDEKEREKAISKCEQGACIDQIWKEEVWQRDVYEKVLAEIKVYRELFDEKIEKDGVASIPGGITAGIFRSQLDGGKSAERIKKYREIEESLKEKSDGVLRRNEANQQTVYLKKQEEKSDALGEIMGEQFLILLSALDNLCTIKRVTGHGFMQCNLPDSGIKRRLLERGRWREKSQFIHIADSIVDLFEKEGLML